MFKKNDRSQKLNYRHVSILPTCSKIYEKFLCGFREGHSTQHCLLYMLENLRKSLDKGLKTGVLLTDLSKVFNSISHDLLIAKLNAYGFCKNAFNLVNDYLTDRKQRTKIVDTFSSWRDKLYGVLQGSFLGPLLFNIYLSDLFLFLKEFKIANYADDCSPFEFSGSINELIHKLEVDSSQHSLHCSVMHNADNGNPTYFYHLSDDLKYDYVYTNTVARQLFHLLKMPVYTDSKVITAVHNINANMCLLPGDC